MVLAEYMTNSNSRKINSIIRREDSTTSESIRAPESDFSRFTTATDQLPFSRGGSVQYETGSDRRFELPAEQHCAIDRPSTSQFEFPAVQSDWDDYSQLDEAKSRLNNNNNNNNNKSSKKSSRFKLSSSSCSSTSSKKTKPASTKNLQRSKLIVDSMIASSRMDYLTQRQRKRIVDTWRSIEDRRQLGQRIYMQIFMNKPSLKMSSSALKCQHLTSWILLVTQTLFTFGDVPVDQLKNNAYFNRQSTIFADFLHTIVGFVQINSENLLRDLCHRVGIRHAQFTKIDFEPDWWRTFVEAALDCLQAYFPHATARRRTRTRTRTRSSDRRSETAATESTSLDSEERTSRRTASTSSKMVAQLPFVGNWLRDAHKRAWSILLEHAVSLMRDAFTTYRLGMRRVEERRRESPPHPTSQSDHQPTDPSDDRGEQSSPVTRCLGMYNHGRDFDLRSHVQDDDDDEIELQLVIVTTPIEDYEGEEDEDGETAAEPIIDPRGQYYGYDHPRRHPDDGESPYSDFHDELPPRYDFATNRHSDDLNASSFDEEEEQQSSTSYYPTNGLMQTSYSLQTTSVPPRSWETTRKHAVLRLSSLEDWDCPY